MVITTTEHYSTTTTTTITTTTTTRIGRLGKRWGKVGCVVPSSDKRTVTDRGEPSGADCDGFRGEKALGFKRLIAPL